MMSSIYSYKQIPKRSCPGYLSLVLFSLPGIFDRL